MAAPLSGALGRRIGFPLVVLLGTVTSAAGFLLTSVVQALPYAYLSYGVLVGLGTSFMFAGSTSLMLDWFAGKASVCRSTGVCTMGASTGKCCGGWPRHSVVTWTMNVN